MPIRLTRALPILVLSGLFVSLIGCSPEPSPPTPPRPGASGAPSPTEPQLVIKEGEYRWAFVPQQPYYSEQAGDKKALVQAPNWSGTFTINPDGTVKGSATNADYRAMIHCEEKALETIPSRQVPVKSNLGLEGRVRGLKLELQLVRSDLEMPFLDFNKQPIGPCPKGPIPEGAKILEIAKRVYGDAKPIDITAKPDRRTLCVEADGPEGSVTETGIEGVEYKFQMCPKGK